MFWSKTKKNKYTPVNPFFYIKVGCKGVFVKRTYVRDDIDEWNSTMFDDKW